MPQAKPLDDHRLVVAHHGVARQGGVRCKRPPLLLRWMMSFGEDQRTETRDGAGLPHQAGMSHSRFSPSQDIPDPSKRGRAPAQYSLPQTGAGVLIKPVRKLASLAADLNGKADFQEPIAEAEVDGGISPARPGRAPTLCRPRFNGMTTRQPQAPGPG